MRQAPTYTPCAQLCSPQDVINEPRCPGCTEDWQQRIHLAWLSEMTAFLKAQAPNQLVAVGTEGYFMPSAGDDSTKWNPGGWGLALVGACPIQVHACTMMVTEQVDWQRHATQL